MKYTLQNIKLLEEAKKALFDIEERIGDVDERGGGCTKLLNHVESKAAYELMAARAKVAEAIDFLKCQVYDEEHS